MQAGLRLGAYAIDNGLGLYEIDAAIQEGALGELARSRETRAGPEGKREHRVDRAGASMTVDLHDIFARVRVGRAHDVDEDLVYGQAFVADLAVENLAAIAADVAASRRLEQTMDDRDRPIAA